MAEVNNKNPKTPKYSPEEIEEMKKKTQEKIHKMNDSPYTYAILMETSGEEFESWYSFIRYQGNEEALEHLQNQLKKVDWEIIDDISTFDLEMDYLVSERTAKEMSKVDLNPYSFHRKFDGKLKKIDLRIDGVRSNTKKMSRIFDTLGYGGIEKFIDGEDEDPEDINGDDTDEDETSEEESSEEEEETSSEEDEEDSKKVSKKKTHSHHDRHRSRSKKSQRKEKKSKKPIEIPRFAKAKKH